jgi:hypothetical protein
MVGQTLVTLPDAPKSDSEFGLAGRKQVTSAGVRFRPIEGCAEPIEGCAEPIEGRTEPITSSQPPGFCPPLASRWKADAVGSDWPWYFEPSPGEPYGRSTALDIWKNEIWPIFIPK